MDESIYAQCTFPGVYLYIAPFIKQANVFSPKQNICLYVYINLFIYTI